MGNGVFEYTQLGHEREHDIVRLQCGSGRNKTTLTPAVFRVGMGKKAEYTLTEDRNADF